MDESLKQGDFVIVYDLTYGKLVKGIVVNDEYVGNSVSVVIVKGGLWSQNYYERKNIIKI